MKLLIVDSSSEGQVVCAKKVEHFPAGAAEHLDLHIQLSSDRDFSQKLANSDVVVFGAALGEQAISLARKTIAAAPSAHIIMFVKGASYSEDFLRAAYAAGVRKILSESAPILDFYQELLSIHAGFRREGKTKDGRLIVVTSSKGGTGSTTMAAALGEVLSTSGLATLLWDLDVDTRDLSRALLAFGPEGNRVSAWVRDISTLTKENFRKSLVDVGHNASLLVAPDAMAEGLDLLCHVDGVSIALRILELARVAFDVIIVDAGGVTGPAKGALMRAADKVLVLVGDSSLAYTAAEHSLQNLKRIVGDTSRLGFLCVGGKLSLNEVRALVDPNREVADVAWSLPIVEVDHKAANWAGTNQTLFSKGSLATKKALVDIALALGLINQEQASKMVAPGSGQKSKKLTGLFQHVLFNK